MPFRVLPVEKDDWPQLVSISHRAWGNEPIWNFLYPALDTPEGTAQAISRLSQSFDKNPEIQWIKVVEQNSDTIVGAACWHFYTEDPYTRDGPGTGVNRSAKVDWLGGEDNPTRQFFEFFYNEKRDRREEFAELRRAHSYLQVLYVDPTYRRKGVASTALRWGLSRTDEMGTPCYLEATRSAYSAGIYQSHGYYDITSMEFRDERPIERRSEIPYTWHTCMVRPAKGESPPQRIPDQVHVFP
ncbi:hypothetical protein EV356DRAFT_532904 [Viridothelium virens]|uniref:N-acetyltransferase domain-containing protein n=1 Tax=Viridothelium virens TaxID=1048519 RepID=A0A6A6H8F5_VIRVR|nr:hypothetical protein EV356DRAFT_532904 [Viridothelium virens]